MPVIHPIILSGGAGSRLWPLSRGLFPKQLLALTSERSLLQETVARAAGDGFGRPFIVCNVEHRFLIAEQMREAAMAPAAVVLEPEGRNTAPAAAVAAILVAAQDPNALMLVMPADHVIRDVGAFHYAITRAEPAAASGHLVAFGIAPDAPETGYGYIRKAGALTSLSGCFSVARFLEKPDAATAAGGGAAGGGGGGGGGGRGGAAAGRAGRER